MEERTIRSVLRIAGVLVMLGALILATRTILTVWGIQQQFGSLAGQATDMAGWTVLVDIATWGWGLALYAASAHLARRIAA